MVRPPFAVLLVSLLLGLLPTIQHAPATLAHSAAPAPDDIPGLATTSDAPPSPTLDTILAADGTVQLPEGFSGALNAAGWTMETLPDGRPRFVREETPVQAALGGPENWDTRFSSTGVDDTILAMAVFNGEIYAGGFFRAAGSILANYVARYSLSTNSWSTLGAGVNAPVRAFAVIGNTLYLAGDFSLLCADADCTTTQPANGVNRIAAWNGSSFSAVGNGINSTVQALAASGSTLYLGGSFTRICTNADCSATQAANGVNRIAAWNGASYSALGNGVNNLVFALAANGSTVYLGGNFFALCSNADCSTIQAANGVNNIASWNGSSFSPLGNGLNGLVTALAPAGLGLYVGGQFDLVCASANCGFIQPANGVNNVAYWEGAFSPLGFGVNGRVNTIAVSGSTVYLGGNFNRLCGGLDCGALQAANGFNYVAGWSGGVFSPIGAGVNQFVTDFAVSGSTVYLAGGLTKLCSNANCSATSAFEPGRIAAFDGFSFATLPPTPAAANGVSGTIYALAVMNGEVYAGGLFQAAGPILARNLVRYSPASNSWSSVGNGLNGTVFALLVSGSTLYIGGGFQAQCATADCSSVTPGGALNRVAAWNGSAFSSLGNGINEVVYALAMQGSTLYLGGDFTRLCSNADCSTTQPANGVNRLAAWNGTSYSALGNGVNTIVYTLAVSGSILYLGGAFFRLCSNADCTAHQPANGMNRIASWNGSVFSPLGMGLNNAVYALTLAGSTLYIGGNFSRLCSNNDCSVVQIANGVNRLAAWNGSVYSALGFGVNTTVYALGTGGSTLYIGGAFTRLCAVADCITNEGSLDHSAITSWNGSGYSTLGRGIDPIVHALAIAGDLYAGGDFERTGRSRSRSIARWGEVADLAVSAAASAATALPGATISYSITLVNGGPSSGQDVSLTIALPANATLTSVTPSAGTCSGSGPVTCVFGILTPGQQRAVTALMTAVSDGVATLTATAATLQVDAAGNSSGSASVTIQTPPPTVFPILLPLIVSQAAFPG